MSTYSYSSISSIVKNFSDIYDFYVAQAPIKKNKNETGVPLKWLGEYGWTGNKELQSLERSLLQASGIPSFCMLKADFIDGTLNEMMLKDKICIHHPRAVMMINKSVSINEDGTVAVKATENRMVCLLRHIRNSLAHGLTYCFENDFILLEDLNTASKRISARLLIDVATLCNWIDIITNNNSLSSIKN